MICYYIWLVAIFIYDEDMRERLAFHPRMKPQPDWFPTNLDEIVRMSIFDPMKLQDMFDRDPKFEHIVKNWIHTMHRWSGSWRDKQWNNEEGHDYSYVVTVRDVCARSPDYFDNIRTIPTTMVSRDTGDPEGECRNDSLWQIKVDAMLHLSAMKIESDFLGEVDARLLSEKGEIGTSAEEAENRIVITPQLPMDTSPYLKRPGLDGITVHISDRYLNRVIIPMCRRE